MHVSKNYKSLLLLYNLCHANVPTIFSLYNTQHMKNVSTIVISSIENQSQQSQRLREWIFL